jgi:hypothetical protein
MFVKTFPISDLERTHGPSLETTQQVLSSLQKDGVCVLQHLIPKDIASKNYERCIEEWTSIEQAQKPLKEMYEGHLQEVVPRYAELAPRGPRRYSISTFQSSELKSNVVIKHLLANALQSGGKSHCFSEETVISLPGSDQQRVHVDAGHLYDPHLFTPLPAYHYSCFIALCDQTSATGNTAFSLGSHRTHGGGHEAKSHWEYPKMNTFVDAYLEAGSCVIFDSRLYHMGRPNRSESPRPIYGLMYSNVWYQAGTSYFGTNSIRQERAEGRLISWEESVAQDKVQPEDSTFILQHASQLQHLSIPNVLWSSVASKFRSTEHPVLDAQDVFALGIVNDDIMHGTSTSCSGVGSTSLDVVATKSIHAFEGVWLIQHIWTWQDGMEEADRALSNDDGLLAAVCGTVLPMQQEHVVAAAVNKVCELAQCYSVASGNENEETVQCWFLVDALGCHLREASIFQPSRVDGKDAGAGDEGVGEASGGVNEDQDGELCKCNVVLSPAFVDVRTGVACSIIFPIRDIAEGEVVRLPSRSRASLAPKS